VGIDGVENNSLIQIGTEQDWDGSGAQFEAWWEILPAAATRIPMAVRPGDDVCGAVTQGSDSTWTLSISDQTTDTQFSTEQQYTGPADSAEWIMERPVVCNTADSCAFSTLADYGQTSSTRCPTTTSTRS
jgi:hypothetical protein